MAIEVGSAAGVDLETRTSSGKPRAGLEELQVVVSDVLAGFFLFAVASLGAASSSGLLETAQLLWGFFEQVVILEWSGVERKKSFKLFQTG